jgi:hypothetical protein
MSFPGISPVPSYADRLRTLVTVLTAEAPRVAAAPWGAPAVDLASHAASRSANPAHPPRLALVRERRDRAAPGPEGTAAVVTGFELSFVYDPDPDVVAALRRAAGHVWLDSVAAAQRRGVPADDMGLHVQTTVIGVDMVEGRLHRFDFAPPDRHALVALTTLSVHATRARFSPPGAG